LNGEAIIDFKWRTFGRYYYFLIWLIFIAFQICFIIGSLLLTFITNEIRHQLYTTTIAIGFIHLFFEFRQLIWNPIEYITSIWNFFDLCAYLLPIITSFLWILNNDVSSWLISLSCLFLNIKFLLFFRAFEPFGIFFAIIFGVISRISSFLVILIIIIASFALSFHLLLTPKDRSKLFDDPNNPEFDDPNSPWSLSKKFYQFNQEDKSINPKFALIQVPEENTNLFASFHTSLMATYLFLTGDSSSLTQWAPTAENTLMIILMSLFSFLVVIYLMNLLIGVLNTAIEKDRDRASYLVNKAEILAEIELFYLLPHQRRWKHWFPEVIHYKVRIDIARKYFREAIQNGKWVTDDCPKEYKRHKNECLKELGMLDLIEEDKPF